MFYTNETIVLSRAGQTDATIAAADKAIAADPTKAIAYYLKGQALISKATVDPRRRRSSRLREPPRLYNKYLELCSHRAHGAGSKVGFGGDGGKTEPRATKP